MHAGEQGGSKIVPGARVNVISDPIHVPVAGEREVGNPHLFLRREHDVITEIEVTCRCGCKMVLICDYENSRD